MIIPAKRGQFLWVGTKDDSRDFVVVDVIAWEVGEVGMMDRPIPITPSGRVDPCISPCVLATAAGFHVLRENVVFRTSTDAIAYLRANA